MINPLNKLNKYKLEKLALRSKTKIHRYTDTNQNMTVTSGVGPTCREQKRIKIQDPAILSGIQTVKSQVLCPLTIQADGTVRPLTVVSLCDKQNLGVRIRNTQADIRSSAS